MYSSMTVETSNLVFTYICSINDPLDCDPGTVIFKYWL